MNAPTQNSDVLPEPGLMVVGRVVGVHGIRGEIKVKAMIDDTEAFEQFDGVVLAPDSIPLDQAVRYEIAQVRFHKGCVLLTLDAIRDRNAAEAMIGHRVAVVASEVPEIAEDHYRIGDLKGLHVRDGQGQTLGTVLDVEDIPSNPVLEVKLDGGIELLVPFSRSYIESVDMTAKILVLRECYRDLLFPLEDREVGGRRRARK